MWHYRTPRELVEAVKRHEPEARRVLQENLREPTHRLVEAAVEEHGLCDEAHDSQRLTDHTLRSLELHLVAEPVQTFNGMSWDVFRAYAVAYCWKVLCAPSQYRGRKPKNRGTSDTSQPRGHVWTCSRAFTIHWYDRPLGKAGGDWWTYEEHTDRSLRLFVADVSGHSYAAHLLRAGVRDLWEMARQQRAQTDATPRTVLDTIDQTLASVLPLGDFVEATSAHFSGNSEKAHLCGAGRAIIGWQSSACSTSTFGGPYLGMWGELGPQASERDELLLDFLPGAEALLATDGLWDQSAKATEHGGVSERVREVLDRILKLAAELRKKNFDVSPETHLGFAARTIAGLTGVRSLHEAAIACLEQAIQLCGQEDDVCVVSIERKPLPTPEWLTSNTPPADPDQRLAWEVCHRVSDAVGRFQERFTRLALWLANRKLAGSPQPDLEEACRDAIVHALNKLPTWRGTSLKSWVGKTVRNYLLDLATKSKERSRTLPLDDMPTEPATRPGVAGEADSRIEETEELVEQVQRKLAALPERERLLITMVAEGLPHRTIWQALGYKEGTYWLTLRQIREKLGHEEGGKL